MKRADDKDTNKKVWRPPTRRAFVTMLGAAAASFALSGKRSPDEAPRSTWTGKTRWIGHC